jgi:hypothetical protein
MHKSTFSLPRQQPEVSELHAAAALPPGYIPEYPMDMRLSGLQTWSGRHGDITILGLTWTLIRTPRSLYTLRYSGSSYGLIDSFYKLL